MNMHWEMDYRNTDDWDKLLNIPIETDSEEKIKTDVAKILDNLRIYNSQYTEWPNRKKRDKIIWFYWRLVEIALVNEGFVSLDIDDEKKTATLKYTGEFLAKTCEDNDKTGMVLATIFYLYDFVSIENKSDEFIITIFEKLYDRRFTDSK